MSEQPINEVIVQVQDWLDNKRADPEFGGVMYEVADGGLLCGGEFIRTSDWLQMLPLHEFMSTAPDFTMTTLRAWRTLYQTSDQGFEEFGEAFYRLFQVTIKANANR